MLHRPRGFERHGGHCAQTAFHRHLSLLLLNHRALLRALFFLFDFAEEQNRDVTWFASD